MSVRRIAGLVGIATVVSAVGVAVAPPALAAVPGLSVASLSVTETNASQVKTVAVRLSAASTATVRVKVASANVTALATKDYTAVPLTTLTFSPGQVLKNVAVTVLGDTLDEANETFKLVLSAPSGATITRGTGVVTIVDEDAPPAVRVLAQSLAEGSAGLADRSVAVSLSTRSGKAVSVAWATTSGTAVSGDDYEPASGTVTVPAGALSANVAVSVDGDTTDEADERFYLGLSAPLNATISSTYGRVVLLDDDAPRTPVLSALPKAAGQSDLVTLHGVAESGTALRVYLTADCTGPAITSSAEQLNGTGGVAVQVPENATTSLTVDSVNARSEASACSNAVSYTQDEVAPATPVSSGLQPSSYANDNSPRVTGTATGTTVLVYRDTCGGTVVASGTPGDFAGTGIAFPVADDEAVSVFAATRDAAGNTSACTAYGTYTEDSTAPDAPTSTGFLPGAYADDNSPEVTGLAQGTIVLVHSGSCAGPQLAIGTAIDYFTTGVTFTVGDDTTTAVFVSTMDGAGNESDCVSFGTYTEDSTVPGAVVGLAFTSGTDGVGTKPTVTGTSDNGGVQVWSGDCNTLLATLTQSQLAAGARIPAAAVATTSYLVDNFDLAGHHLGCASGTPLAYREISTEHETSNESSGAATALANTPGLDSMLGELGTVSDEDWYSLTLAAPSNLRIETLAVPGGAICANNALTSLDSKVWLYDASLVLIASDDDTGTGFCSLLTRTAQAAGTYYVKVTTTTFSNAPDLPFPLSYRLDVSSGQLAATSLASAAEVEGNDTAGTAQALGSLSGATNVLGHVALGDADYYAFTLAGAATITATTQDASNAQCEDNDLDTALTFYGTDGTTVLASNDDSGPGFCSRVTYAFPGAGTYFVKVSPSGFATPGTADGDYVLALR